MNNFTHFYFIGIGGIGMSALAFHFKHLGYTVSGYDKSEGLATQALMKANIEVLFEDEPAYLPAWMQPQSTIKQQICVVRTPAVPADSRILQYCQNNGFSIAKRSAVLGTIAATMPTMAVAGTHGKTTTSALLAHIARCCNQQFTAILGGMASNFNGNWFCSGSDWLITEADEYDRSFLALHPAFAVITATDPDHLDIYGTPQALNDAYNHFAKQVTKVLCIKHGLNIGPTSATQVITYGIEQGDYYAKNITVHNGIFIFDFVTPSGIFPKIRCGLPGKHNVENAVAALALAFEAGFDNKLAIGAIATYQGVSRRLSAIFGNGSHWLYDDYAHHPKEIAALLDAIKQIHPYKRIMGIFQPHLYSRTRDFGQAFAKALSVLDTVILLPIYPARELPIAQVTTQTCILNHMQGNAYYAENLSAVLNFIEAAPAGVWLTIGAGSIDQMVQPIAQLLAKKGNKA